MPRVFVRWRPEWLHALLGRKGRAAVRRLARGVRAAGCAALAALVALAAMVLAPATAAPVLAAPGDGTTTFGCNGGAAVNYSVPDGMTRLYVLAAGAAGGKSDGGAGNGGSVEAVVPVQPGSVWQVQVGCAGRDATDQGASAGSGGAGFGAGARGGRSTLHNSGGGGGGGSAVSAFGSNLVVAGGGGGGGGDGFGVGHGRAGGDGSQTGERGTRGGASSGFSSAPGGLGGDSATSDGEVGFKSVGGGGGGGGGGGFHGGGGGHGGGCDSCGGGGGGGGSSFVDSRATNVTFTRGDVTGDGYVVIVPLKLWSTVPTAAAFSCTGGTSATYTVPSTVSALSVVAGGGSGGNVGLARPSGNGALVEARLPVNAGARLSVIVGCSGPDRGTGGRGYSNGGSGGSGGSSSGSGAGGGGASALLDVAGTPLVVAGGGGGGGGDGTVTNGGRGGDGSQAGDKGNGGGGSLGGGGGAGGGQTSSNGTGGGGSNTGGGAGGGGGGFRGGNGGRGGSAGSGGGGGGGGSSFVTSLATNVPKYTAGGSHGSGLVVLVAAPASVPDLPTNVTATAGNQQASVAFTPSADDGGQPITGYTVTSFNLATGRAGITRTGTASSDRCVRSDQRRHLQVQGRRHQRDRDEHVALLQRGHAGLDSWRADRCHCHGRHPPGNGELLNARQQRRPADHRIHRHGQPGRRNGYRPGRRDQRHRTAERRDVYLHGRGHECRRQQPGFGGVQPGDAAQRAGRAYQCYEHVHRQPGDHRSLRPTRQRRRHAHYRLHGHPRAPRDHGRRHRTPSRSARFSPRRRTPSRYTPPTARAAARSRRNPTRPWRRSSRLHHGTLLPRRATARLASSGARLWIPAAARSTTYTIITSPGGGRLTVPPPTPDSQGFSSAVVTGLTNGTAYTFTVVATNVAGTSLPSAATNSVTPRADTGPANDNFANAQVISGASGTVTATNVGAGKEAGEPDHADNPGGASIWYAWTAPGASTS